MILKTALFVLGVWVVQHLAQLPNILWLLIASAYIVFILFFLPRFVSHLSHSHQFLIAISRYITFFIIGVIWASVMAAWRLQDALPETWQQKEVEVIGIVASLPEVTPSRTRFRFLIETINTPEAVVPKHISLNVYHQPFFSQTSQPKKEEFSHQFKAGQRWRFTVKLKRPHGDINPHGFDFSAWSLSENIRAWGYVRTKRPIVKVDDFVWRPMTMVNRVREMVQEHIQSVLADKPYLGVVTALVIGEDKGIKPDTWQLLLRTGVTHLMSISGLHITMLSSMAFALVYGVWRQIAALVLLLPARKAATLAGVIVACSYAFVAGFSVPTQRTFYMLMVFALALWSGRKFQISQVLTIAIVVVLLVDPWAVTAAGFWLSFGAVVLITYALNGRLTQSHWLYSAVKTQWSVTIGMLPVLLLLFHQASVVSPIANAVAIPVVSIFVTPLALLGGFLSWEWPLTLSQLILSGLMQVLDWLDRWSHSLWSQQAPPSWTIWPAIIGILVVLLPRGLPLRFLGLLGLVPMLLIPASRPALGDMQVTVLAVGQGLSVHVQTAKHDLLYDAGPKYNALSDAGLRVILPYLNAEGIQQLSILVVSHDDNDHSGGMESILAVMPDTQLLTSFSDENVPDAKSCVAGQQWNWDGVQFEVLYPTKEILVDAAINDNDKSCVIKVTSKAGSVLLTGDIERYAERELLDSFSARLNSTVLIVPHHGSRTSSSSSFLTAVAPQYSVVSSGYLNRFHHPHAKIIDRYRKVNSQLLRTDHAGAVRFMFHSETGLKNEDVLKVETWRTRVPRYWRDSVESSLN